MRNVSDEAVEKITTHILRSVSFFLENRAIHEIMWKNSVEPDRPQMKIWNTRVSCLISKATNTHPEYSILIAFLLQQ
jgi:hypothetical protein